MSMHVSGADPEIINAWRLADGLAITIVPIVNYTGVRVWLNNGRHLLYYNVVKELYY